MMEKYLNPLYWFANLLKMLFKARMRSFYSPFRQACYRDKKAMRFCLFNSFVRINKVHRLNLLSPFCL